MGTEEIFDAETDFLRENYRLGNYQCPKKYNYCNGSLFLIFAVLICVLFLYDLFDQSWQTSPFPVSLKRSWTILATSNMSSDNVTLDSFSATGPSTLVWLKPSSKNGDYQAFSPSILKTTLRGIARKLPNFVTFPDDSEGDSLQVIRDYQEDWLSAISNVTEPSCGYLILAENGGRLGNQMFVYASFYGLLHRKPVPENKTVFQRVSIIPSFLGQIFDNLTITPRIISDSWYRRRKDKVARIGDRWSSAYDDRGLDQTHACDGKVVEYTGFRQSYKYFYNCSDEIRREFSFKPEIRRKAKKMLDSVKMNITPGCVTVGVHLRRGDFTEGDKIRFGYVAAKLDYFERAVHFFQQKILWGDHLLTSTRENKSNCLAFLIFGNDLSWNKNASDQIKSRLENSNHTHFFLFNPWLSSGPVDMCVMSLCDHVIISTGTFSWWIGFLNRGIVTYQKEYAVMNSYLYNQTNPDDYFLPGWIGL